MKKQKIHFLLHHEEKRALIAYLIPFYLTLILYDFFYYYLYPKYIRGTAAGFDSSLSYWNYVVFILLIPVSYLLAKMGKLQTIKYMYIIVYFVLTIFTDIVVFLSEPAAYKSGNAAELILILFSPIFINNRFYWVASVGAIFRYLIVGIVIKAPEVFVPIALIIVLSGIAYVFLRRFSSYIFALTSTYEELRHKEKLAFIGQMAASIGHEIRNPLASLKGFTQLQREKYLADEPYFSIMEQEIDRINSIVNDLLLLGKPKSSQFQKSDIKDIISYVISITQQLAFKKKITLSMEVDDRIPPVECDENQLKQVFINLIKNGLDSMNDGGIFKVNSTIDSNNKLWVSFIDQGCGINPCDIDKLFNPFYTTKADGTGLGLIVTKKIVEDHQGQIKVDSELEKGTKVDVILPIVQ